MKTYRYFFISIAIFFTIYECSGQSSDDWFTFDIPPLDTLIPEFYPIFEQPPIGNDDFITINSEGHFEVKGERMRFWGTPCSREASGSLPKSKYPSMVKELKKNGVNIVRFHLWDSENFNPGTSFFGGAPNTLELDPDAVDRLDYLIYLLKKNGIYAYIDLLCERIYTAGDGVYSPDSTNRAAKMVNFFDPKLIELQKEFARQLLTHENPYTGNTLVDEPTVAFIDIVNEGWFFHSLRSREIRIPKDGGKLSHYHFNMLTDQWNDFLLEKYGTTEEIEKAWGINGLLSAGGFEDTQENWIYWSYWGPDNFNLNISTDDAYSGNNSFHVNSNASSANSYDCQLQYSESVFQSNMMYELKFYAKSNDSSKIGYTVQINESPWTSYSSRDFIVTDEWTVYADTFEIENFSSSPYLFFNLGLVEGDVWIDNVTLKNIKAKGDEKYDWYYIEDIMMEDQRKADQAEFLISLQENYYAEIHNYLKDSLGVKVPVTGSNYLTGPTDIAIQSNTDFIDNHGYWLPWSLGPVSMIPHTDYYNPILGLFSGSGVAGKPYTVSEYNYQFVNYFAYEALFFLTGYGAFHEADMLMVHRLEYDEFWDFMFEGVAGYSQISYRALQPTMAYAYRNELIAPANKTVEVTFSDNDLKKYVYKNNPWSTDLYPNDYPFKLAYQNKVRIKLEENASGVYVRSDYPQEPNNPFKTDTEEIIWDNTGLFQINTPQFCAFVGDFTKFDEKSIGFITLEEGDKSAGFTMLALDNKSLNESEKLMMTLTTQMKNTGMIIDGFEMIDFGEKPRIVEASSVKFRLKTDMENMDVFWLDKRGQKSGYYETFENNGNGEIPFTINTYEHPGVWFGIEKYNANPTVARFDSIKSVNFNLYPNPTKGVVNMKFENFNYPEYKLIITNTSGVKMLQKKLVYSETYKLDLSDFPKGVYLIQLIYGNEKSIRKLIIK